MEVLNVGSAGTHDHLPDGTGAVAAEQLEEIASEISEAEMRGAITRLKK